jgi:riboflavin synthase
MFTGLVEALVKIESIQQDGPGKSLCLNWPLLHSDIAIGDSVAINGCCLTVVGIDGNLLTFEAGTETLSRTNLGLLEVGTQVNVERALKYGDRLGGHLVSGHIDATVTLLTRVDDADWSNFTFQIPSKLSRQMASKGSVAVDGVSLTLVDVTRESFSVALIPHTLNATTLGMLQPGDTVNLETDLLAKYVEAQLAWRNVDAQ